MLLAQALQESLFGLLHAELAVTNLVAARIYDYVPSPPTFPYIRYGVDSATDFTSDCDFTKRRFSAIFHAFSNRKTRGEIRQICSALEVALDDKTPDVAGYGYAHVMYQSSQIIPDTSETGSWHGMATFDVIPVKE